MLCESVCQNWLQLLRGSHTNLPQLATSRTLHRQGRCVPTSWRDTSYRPSPGEINISGWLAIPSDFDYTASWTEDGSCTGATSLDR
ncbi:hypothetical protein WJX82_000209 [Trebouxia sp. C0006]